MMTFYDFEAAKLNGQTVIMSEYHKKVIIVVNTASKCGFTPQYEGLEKLPLPLVWNEGLMVLRLQRKKDKIVNALYNSTIIDEY